MFDERPQDRWHNFSRNEQSESIGGIRPTFHGILELDDSFAVLHRNIASEDEGRQRAVCDNGPIY